MISNLLMLILLKLEEPKGNKRELIVPIKNLHNKVSPNINNKNSEPLIRLVTKKMLYLLAKLTIKLIYNHINLTEPGIQ